MTEHTKDVAKLRRAFQERDAVADATAGDVPSADDMWNVATGEVRGAAARRILERVIADPELAAEWRITVRLVREAGIEPAWSDAGVAPTPWWRSTRWLAGWGAAAVAVAVLVFLLMPSKPTPDDVPPTLRTNDGAAITSSVAPSLPRHRFELAWSGAPPGARFEVHVMTAKLKPVYSAYDLTKPRALVPADRLRALPTNAALVWRVVAITKTGERIECKAFDIRVD